MTQLVAPRIPHISVWVENEGTGQEHCALCGRTPATHPEYLDEDVALEDDE